MKLWGGQLEVFAWSGILWLGFFVLAGAGRLPQRPPSPQVAMVVMKATGGSRLRPIRSYVRTNPGEALNTTRSTRRLRRFYATGRPGRPHQPLRPSADRLGGGESGPSIGSRSKAKQAQGRPAHPRSAVEDPGSAVTTNRPGRRATHRRSHRRNGHFDVAGSIRRSSSFR